MKEKQGVQVVVVEEEDKEGRGGGRRGGGVRGGRWGGKGECERASGEERE
jgi:hypothetical protein